MLVLAERETRTVDKWITCMKSNEQWIREDYVKLFERLCQSKRRFRLFAVDLHLGRTAAVEDPTAQAPLPFHCAL